MSVRRGAELCVPSPQTSTTITVANIIITNNNTAATTTTKCMHILTRYFSFLKDQPSANPHNDYSQHFVDTLRRPQNFIRDADMITR